jgi:hypothetical protein
MTFIIVICAFLSILSVLLVFRIYQLKNYYEEKFSHISEVFESLINIFLKLNEEITKEREQKNNEKLNIK